jgi:precorrin-2 dehydrogenase/sirohydrochlorin ferrochelatase
VVVGGGTVAARKVVALREAGAEVLVIAPDLCDPLDMLVGQQDVDLLARTYRRGDLEGAFLVIAATDDPTVNRDVWKEAEERGLLVNVVDDPDHCNFIAPSVVRRGPLTVAVSTSGRCPALSRHLRKRLEREFGPAYGGFVTLLGELRDEAVSSLSLAERRALWKEIFESDVLPLLTAGDEEGAHSRVRAILNRSLSGRA